MPKSTPPSSNVQRYATIVPHGSVENDALNRNRSPTYPPAGVMEKAGIGRTLGATTVRLRAIELVGPLLSVAVREMGEVPLRAYRWYSMRLRIEFTPRPKSHANQLITPESAVPESEAN